jgi:uncharacterized protein involved in cysteine biosynthesis
MPTVFQALWRSFVSLARPGLWRYLLAPAFFSLLLWVGLMWFGFAALLDWLLDNPPFALFISWGMAWLAYVLACLSGWAVIFALAYLSAAVIAAIFVLPWLLEALAARDYPELARMGRENFAASTWNSLAAAALFVVGWLLSLPLWLAPGLGFILPLLLMAWFNRRTFAFDCLSAHATAEESREIRRRQALPLFMLGVALALLAHVPVLGLFVPALTAFAYLHFCLEALRQLRGGALVSLPARDADERFSDNPTFRRNRDADRE